jgi:hypothetical protein
MMAMAMPSTSETTMPAMAPVLMPLPPADAGMTVPGGGGGALQAEGLGFRVSVQESSMSHIYFTFGHEIRCNPQNHMHKNNLLSAPGYPMMVSDWLAPPLEIARKSCGS